jgi:hypothetical protein
MLQTSSAVGRSSEDGSAASSRAPIRNEHLANDDFALILAFFDLLAMWEAREERAM